jgi:NADPH:quinone reductase-like Zn-dependent oxidoreductase
VKAIAQDEFGPPDILELRKVEDPTVVARQVLVRVRAASRNPWDWHFARGRPYISRPQPGWRKPKNEVLDSDVAGHVKAVGKDGTRFCPGDEVFGFAGRGDTRYFARIGYGLRKPNNRFGFAVARQVGSRRSATT